MRLTKTIFVVWLVLLTSGCGKAIQGFVMTGSTPRQPDSVGPAAPLSTSKSVKTSAGAGTIKGSQVQGSAHLTPTHFSFRGSQVQGTASISQNRQQ